MKRTALIVVDFQEDFCPPDGSLAVLGGRDIAGIINELLDLPFDIKIATQDWHPQDHISFASNHPEPDNKPFESFITIKNPADPSETVTTRVWPVHCVQGTKGAELVPELNVSKIEHIIQKGQDKRVEMYSAFRDPFEKPVSQSSLAKLLKDNSIDNVYVVGLAADYCVKETALHAVAEGFKTVIVEEATRGVNASEAAMRNLQRTLKERGVLFQSFSETRSEIANLISQ